MPVHKKVVPTELKQLEGFIEKQGYTLAFPFDSIRLPGYIGGFNDKGQEIIVDDGKCLESVRHKGRGKVSIGSFSRSSKFSLKGFLNAFGNILGLEFGFLKAQSVSLHFPNPLLETQYITEMDVEEALETMPQPCKRNVSNADNFVILQALITDSMEYRFRLGRAASADARLRLNEALAQATRIGDARATISWQSDASFSITIKSQLTVAYKTAKVGVRALAPKELVEMKRTAAAAA